MELLKKLVWAIVIALLFGGFAYGAIQVKNAVTASNYSNYWQERQLGDGEFTLVVMGDSTALGVGASNPEKSFVGLLASNIQASTGKSVKIVNLSLPQATFSDILSKQAPKLSEHEVDTVLVSAGRDDIDKSTFNLGDLQKLMQSLPGVDSYITEIPASYDTERNKIIETANKAINDYADATSVNVIPLYQVTSASIFDLSYYDWDFKHPNDKGHKLWADTIWDKVK